MSLANAPDGRTKLTFLGTSTVVPGAGHDTASLLVNGRILIDTGWYSALKMQVHGFNPLDVDHLILTHCHQDHYIGLPQLLFFRAMRRRDRPHLPLLKVIGPAADVERVVRLSMGLLQPKRFEGVCERPEVVPVTPGETYEGADFRLETCAALHPVQGLSLRFKDGRTGAAFAYSGDTAYNPRLVDHVLGVSLLIHEASFGANPAPNENPSLHSGAPDAARIATEAGVGRLALVHCPEKDQEAALATAQQIFPNTFWPEDGETVLLEN